MDVINYSATRKLLTIARGHPYSRDAFAGLFSDLDDFETCHVEQPVAERLIGPRTASEFDAIVFYDMPGVDFTCADAPGLIDPGEALQQAYLGMLEAGVGLVFMHHAIAAWPAWPDYARIVGGRFHYRPAELGGQSWPDSGYRHQVSHRITVIREHPVTAGLPASFEMTDELYLCPVFEDEVTPLLRSDYRFEADSFYSASQAVAGRMHSRDGWSHPPGSGLVGWVKRYRNSPIVYLQGGDDADALSNEYFRQLIHNAVRWVASDEAREWARNGR